MSIFRRRGASACDATTRLFQSDAQGAACPFKPSAATADRPKSMRPGRGSKSMSVHDPRSTMPMARLSEQETDGEEKTAGVVGPGVGRNWPSTESEAETGTPLLLHRVALPLFLSSSHLLIFTLFRGSGSISPGFRLATGQQLLRFISPGHTSMATRTICLLPRILTLAVVKPTSRLANRSCRPLLLVRLGPRHRPTRLSSTRSSAVATLPSPL